MKKMFMHNPPSINMTLVGFGQAGTRMVDKFAAIKNQGDKPVYNTLALNSNDGDLKELKYIPVENRVSLKLGGLGKNPEKAMAILEENQSAKDTLKEFITQRVRPEDELVLFFAGLGGGTGTSTLVKAIEEFYDYQNKPKIAAELKKIQASTTPEDFRNNLQKYKVAAFKKAQESFVKIGVVVTLPVRSDGPDVLRQVNDFATRIWKVATNPAKGIAFVTFADNQHFYDRWKELGDKAGADNYRDFANAEICDILHEINTGTNGGGTSVTFDPRDFRRIIMEGTGSLVLGKVDQNITQITNNRDLVNMFKKSISSNRLHNTIAIEDLDQETGDVTYSKVHHVGLLAVIDPKLAQLGSAFLDQAKDEITDALPLDGTVFSGYLEEKNKFNATVYTFFKAQALPTRLSKGLVKEFEEYKEKQRKVTFKSETIQQIAAAQEEDIDIDLDLSEFGIEIEDKKRSTDEIEEIDIDNLDLSDIEI
jgi:tubulin-like protein CetZ